METIMKVYQAIGRVYLATEIQCLRRQFHAARVQTPKQHKAGLVFRFGYSLGRSGLRDTYDLHADAMPAVCPRL